MSFKSLLVFPPVWTPEAPFLSTPILSAHLQAHGFRCEQWDLNLELWKHLEEPSVAAGVHDRARYLWGQLKDVAPTSERQRSLQERLALVVGLDEEAFLEEVREGVIDQDTYRDLAKVASRFAISSADRRAQGGNGGPSPYHDLLYSELSLSRWARSSEELRQVVEGSLPNPYAEYFSSSVRQRLLGSSPDLVGISIAAVNQAVPAFTLARLIKEWLPACHVVLGGAWCSMVHARLAEALPSFPYVDSLVIFEGEEPLLRICQALQAGRSLEDVPNHYWNRPGLVSSPRSRWSAELDRLSTPSFEGLSIEDYDFPATLPLQASRGCYWARCTFCSYPALEPTYKVRRVETLIADVRRLQRNHGVKNIGFTDALLSPSFARRFSQGLLDEGLEVRWTMFARFEKTFSPDLLELMGRSGCSLVSWGLESGSPEILDLIQKSIDLDDARRILSAAAAAGIHNRVLVMYGHPTETFEQALATVRFLDDSLENIHSISHNFFHPEFNTPIERLAPTLGIALHADPAEDLALGYEWESSLGTEERAEVKRRFELISQRLASREDSQPGASGGPGLAREFSTRVASESGERLLLSARVKEPAGARRRLFEVETR